MSKRMIFQLHGFVFSLNHSIQIELDILLNCEITFEEILQYFHENEKIKVDHEIIFSYDKYGQQRIGLDIKIDELQSSDNSIIYVFQIPILENQQNNYLQEYDQSKEHPNILDLNEFQYQNTFNQSQIIENINDKKQQEDCQQKDKEKQKNLEQKSDFKNEILIFLEAVGFTWPRDDPKLMYLETVSDICFEEIQYFLKQHENIDQELVFSLDKTGTQRITNLMTTLMGVRIANYGTINVLLKSNLDQVSSQRIKPIHNIRINNNTQNQEMPNLQAIEEQNEFIINIQFSVQIKVQYGLTIQGIKDEFLQEVINNNWAQNAILKEYDGQDISSDPNYILQEPQIRKNRRYILSIGTNNVQQDQRDILKQEIMQDIKGNLNYQSEIALNKNSNKHATNENDSDQESRKLGDLLQDDLYIPSSLYFYKPRSVQIENKQLQKSEINIYQYNNDQQYKYKDIQNELNQLKTEWEQQTLDLKQKFEEIIRQDQQNKLKKIEQLEEKLLSLQQENQMKRNQGIEQYDMKLNEVEILSNSLEAQEQQNQSFDDFYEINQKNEKNDKSQ